MIDDDCFNPFCPACGNDEGKYIGSTHRIHAWRCRGCGWDFITPNNDATEGAQR